MTAQTRAVTYRRISDDKEGRELGVERQREDLAKFAERLGFDMVDDYCDNDISASTLSTKRRPRYEAMVEDAKAGRFDAILAYTSQRLTRRPRESEDLIELGQHHGITFHYIRSPSFDLNTAQGRGIARQRAAADIEQAEITSELVQRAREQQAHQGRWGGGGVRPFGWGVPTGRVGKTRKPIFDMEKHNEPEADEIREWARRRLAGVSRRQIVADLKRRGVPTANGGQWNSKTVSSILTSPRTAGHASYKGEIVARNVVPAILDEPTWMAVCALEKSGVGTGPGRTPQWLGSGIYRCGIDACESTVNVHPNGRRRAPAYRCKAQAHLARDVEQTDLRVEAVIVGILEKPENIALLRKPKSTVDLKSIEAELIELRTMRGLIMTDYTRRRITRQDMLTGIDDLDGQINAIERKMERSVSRSPLEGIVGQPDAAQRWLKLDLGTQRAIVRELVDVTLVASKTGRQVGGGYFDPASVLITPRISE